MNAQRVSAPHPSAKPPPLTAQTRQNAPQRAIFAIFSPNLPEFRSLLRIRARIATSARRQ